MVKTPAATAKKADKTVPAVAKPAPPTAPKKVAAKDDKGAKKK